MGKLACNKHGWCFWLYNFCPALTDKIWNSFIDTYTWWKISHSIFLFSFSFPFITISILFSVSIFSLFFSHETTFCSLSYNFFTDKGIPAHFLTHARILNRHHSLVHHPLFLSLSFLFLFLSLAMWIMMRTLSESRESYQKRIVQRKHRFFQPYHTLLFHLFLSATRFIKSPWDHPL